MSVRVIEFAAFGLASVLVAACQSAASPSPGASPTPASITPPAEMPSPTPTAVVPLPSTKPSVPEGLLYLWIGDSGFYDFAEDGTFGVREDLRDPVEFAGREFTIRASNDAAGCAAGDTGTYAWSLTPNGATLTITPVEDTCDSRAEELDGSFTRSDCPAFPEDFCLGDLEAGSYVSSFYTPLVRRDDWEYNRGAMAYMVPEGWANTADYPDEYGLQPQGAPLDTGIYQWSEAAIVSSAAPCSVNPDLAMKRTPEALAGWLTAHPDLVTTEPVAAEVGGLAGLMVDAKPAAGADLECLGDGIPYLPMLVDIEATGMQTGFKADAHKRFYFLGIDDSRTIIMTIEASGEDEFETLLEPANDIVSSIEYRR
jgi:hypothetical protein